MSSEKTPDDKELLLLVIRSGWVNIPSMDLKKLRELLEDVSIVRNYQVGRISGNVYGSITSRASNQTTSHLE